MLPEGKDADEITARLLEEYDAPAEEIKTDVVAFLDKLRELGIV